MNFFASTLAFFLKKGCGLLMKMNNYIFNTLFALVLFAFVIQGCACKKSDSSKSVANSTNGETANLPVSTPDARPQSTPNSNGDSSNSKETDSTVNKSLDGNVANEMFAMALTDEASLPECNENSKNRLVYILSTKQFNTCDGANWVYIDITGPAGSQGPVGSAGQNGSGLVVKANGKKIGYLTLEYANGYSIRTDKGYHFSINSEFGEIMAYDINNYLNNYYASTDCSGQGYTQNLVRGGIIALKSGTDISLYYAPNNKQSIRNFSYKSIKYLNTCTVTSGTFTNYAVAIYPNDPDVTGVSSWSFPTPITVE
jgi:hypothetical protein